MKKRNLEIPPSGVRLREGISKINNLIAEYNVIASADLKPETIVTRIKNDLSVLKQWLMFGDHYFEKRAEAAGNNISNTANDHMVNVTGAAAMHPHAKIGGILNTQNGPHKF